jgi:hypothetical protein
VLLPKVNKGINYAGILGATAGQRKTKPFLFLMFNILVLFGLKLHIFDNVILKSYHRTLHKLVLEIHIFG